MPGEKRLRSGYYSAQLILKRPWVQKEGLLHDNVVRFLLGKGREAGTEVVQVHLAIPIDAPRVV